MQILDLAFWSLQKARNKGPTSYSNVGDNVAHDARGEFQDIAENMSVIYL